MAPPPPAPSKLPQPLPPPQQRQIVHALQMEVNLTTFNVQQLVALVVNASNMSSAAANNCAGVRRPGLQPCLPLPHP